MTAIGLRLPCLTTVLASVVCLAISGGASSAQAGDRLSGTWVTADQSAHVKFEPCGEFDCGSIVWLKDPVDPETNQPWRDKFNPLPEKQRVPVLGLRIVSDLKEEPASTWRGTLYDPNDGRSYSGQIRRLSPDKIELKGCALAGLICQTEVWSRVPG